MTSRPNGMSPLTLVPAFAAPAAWFVLLTIARPELVGDEVYHVPAIRALAEGDWGPARTLPMPPTYHLLAALWVRLIGGDLWILRAFNALLSSLTLTVFGWAVARHDPDGAAHRLWRLAWNPLVGPLWLLAYTDAAALLGVAFALAFFVRRQHTRAAGGLLLASLIRQSNILWLVAFAALAAINPRGGRSTEPHGRLTELVQRLWPYGVALAAAAILLTHTAPTGPPLIENQPRFNPAQFYLFGLTGALLIAPAWLPAVVALWRRWLERAFLRPWICAVAVAAVGLLELAFSNPHPWNVDLNYLRNWPLLAMTKYTAARYLAAGVLVALVPTVVSLAWNSPGRTALTVVGGATLVFLAAHYLVDPRYYIVPVVLLDFWSAPAARRARQLTIWYVLLSAALAVFIVFQPGGLHGVV
ncbi:MAG: hypothetical protein AB1601_16170 [Planctomycetota bacterium]